MDVRRCPRCGDVMLIQFVRDRRGKWRWVWTCPTCRHEEGVPETIVERLDYE